MDMHIYIYIYIYIYVYTLRQHRHSQTGDAREEEDRMSNYGQLQYGGDSTSYIFCMELPAEPNKAAVLVIYAVAL